MAADSVMADKITISGRLRVGRKGMFVEASCGRRTDLDIDVAARDFLGDQISVSGTRGPMGILKVLAYERHFASTKL